MRADLAVDILTRAGYPATTMIDTLTWLMQIEGTEGGGFFATHPATADRIQAPRPLTKVQYRACL